MDGLVRDIRAIRRMAFPVFHGGIGPLDSKGRGKIIARTAARATQLDLPGRAARL